MGGYGCQERVSELLIAQGPEGGDRHAFTHLWDRGHPGHCRALCAAAPSAEEAGTICPGEDSKQTLLTESRGLLLGGVPRDSRDARTGRQMCLAKCEDGLRSKYMCAEMSFPLSKLTAMSLEVFKWKPRNSWPPKPLLSALQTLVVLVKRHHPIISSNLKRILCSIWEVLVPTQHSITENVFDMNKGRETKKWNWNHIFISLFR